MIFRYFLFFLSIFFISCEKGWLNKILYPPGCTDQSACNFDFNAEKDDDSCLYLDCNGECGGVAVRDCNGDCEGIAVLDCEGICEGDSVLDCSGVCNGSDTIPEGYCDCNGNTFDCTGLCGGLAELDECGVCEGDNLSCTGCMDAEALNYDFESILPCFDCCEYAPVLIEDFANFADWTVELQCGSSSNWEYFSGDCPTNYGGWENETDCYVDSCIYGRCGGYGYGHKITKSFYFPDDGYISFWFKSEYFNNNLYFLIDGQDIWVDSSFNWTQVEIPISSGNHNISFEVRTASQIYIDHVEYIRD